MAYDADIQAFLDKLDLDIDSVMEADEAPAIKKELSDSAFQFVYNAYEPSFYSRRDGNGGILDTMEMEDEYDSYSKTLTVEDKAGWQHLWGGRYPEESLSEMLEEGNERFHFENAGPRPFHEPTERYMDETGIFDSILATGLSSRGYEAVPG